MVSLRTALISTGVLSLAILLKLSVPVVAGFAAAELPNIYTSLLAWLRPPYLYLVINCIILSLVASSKLQQKQQQQQQQKAAAETEHVPEEMAAAPVIVAFPPPEKVSSDSDVRTEYVGGGGGVGSGYGYGRDLEEKEKILEEEEDMVVVMEGGDEGLGRPVKAKAKAPVRSDSMELLMEKWEKEKPLVSKRFGQKKSVKASPEAGKAAALGVSRTKRNDTLESTWRMITDGRPIPLTRHLKKSDTWDTHARATPPSPTTTGKNRSENFSENKSKLTRKESSGKLKKEPSLSQDELNRRVEAFINKFNEEMRLQRQQSLMQYQEMLSRGN